MFSDIDKMTSVIQWGIVIGASLVAAISDLRSRRIPNILTFPVLISGLIWAWWIGGIWGVANSAAACVWLALPFLLLFIFAGGGAGDAKLMGALGVWLGLSEGTVVLVCVMVAGILLSLCKAMMNKKLKVVLTNVFISVYTFVICVHVFGYRAKQLAIRRDGSIVETDALTIPYGMAIFVGVCAAGSLVLL